MSDVATVFVSGIRSLDADALLSAFNMEPSLLDANINAISTLFNRELHFINVNDEDYVRLVCDARLTGERWKARTRDMKGQFCRTKYQANVVWGWSHRVTASTTGRSCCPGALARCWHLLQHRSIPSRAKILTICAASTLTRRTCNATSLLLSIGVLTIALSLPGSIGSISRGGAIAL